MIAVRIAQEAIAMRKSVYPSRSDCNDENSNPGASPIPSSAVDGTPFPGI